MRSFCLRVRQERNPAIPAASNTVPSTAPGAPRKSVAVPIQSTPPNATATRCQLFGSIPAALHPGGDPGQRDRLRQRACGVGRRADASRALEQRMDLLALLRAVADHRRERRAGHCEQRRERREQKHASQWRSRPGPSPAAGRARAEGRCGSA
jgi:hypothetical protein